MGRSNNPLLITGPNSLILYREQSTGGSNSVLGSREAYVAQCRLSAVGSGYVSLTRNSNLLHRSISYVSYRLIYTSLLH